MPIRANPSPVALIITVQGAQAVEVDTNTAVSTPLPSVPAMQVVVVVVTAIQMPVASHIAPMCACPALVHPETVSMSANLAVVVGPEPARTLVVMVATPEMPICAHATPMTLMIAIQSSQTVQVHPNAPEAAPPPVGATMQMMVVMIATPQVPIAADLHPA